MPENFVRPSKIDAASNAGPVPWWSDCYALSWVAKMSAG
jgi:hypothetical protein